jgi:hypothetical protein
MRTLLASAVALALVATASASPADEPPLPAGWVRGAGLAPLPARKDPPWSTFQSNHEFTFRVRQAMPGERHDLAALPVVEVEPSVLPKTPPPELPDEAAGDVVVQRRGDAYRVSLRGFDIGFVRVNGSEPAAVNPRSGGGASGVCRDRGVVPLAYEGIRRVDRAGGIELVWARGWFDGTRCRALIVERYTARPAHLGGGVVYAFRAHCAACAEDARDVLHLVTPQTRRRFDVWTPFEHHTLPIGPGKAAAFEGETSVRLFGWGPALPDWDEAIDRRCGDRSVFCVKRVRVEVSQGRGEPSPTLFVSGDVGG